MYFISNFRCIQTIFFYIPLKPNPGSAISSTISIAFCIKHFIITLLVFSVKYIRFNQSNPISIIKSKLYIYTFISLENPILKKVHPEGVVFRS